MILSVVILAGLAAPAAADHSNADANLVPYLDDWEWSVSGDTLWIVAGAQHDDPDRMASNIDITIIVDDVVLAVASAGSFNWVGTAEPVAWPVADGHHELTLIVDSSNAYHEADEGDNERTWNLFVPVDRAEATVEDIVVTVDRLGMAAEGSYRLCNRGLSSTVHFEELGPVQIAFVQVLAPDGSFVDWLRWDWRISLPPGECQSFTFAWHPTAALGRYELRVSTLCGCRESELQNNVVSVPMDFVGAEWGLPGIDTRIA